MGDFKILINDPIVNELAYDALFQLSQPEHRDKLTAGERRATKTAKTARTWAEKSTIDEKLLLFAKIGISATFFLHPVKWKYKELIEKFRDLTKGQQLAEASKLKMVVVTDRLLVNFLNVMANTTHSDSYLLNMDFHRVGHFASKWKDDNRPSVNKIGEALEYAKILNKFCFTTNIAMKHLRGETIWGDLDLNLLLYFYENQARYVPRGTIETALGGVYKKTLITAAIKRLVNKVMIERNPAVRLPEYQITALGNTSVMEFHSKNLQSV